MIKYEYLNVFFVATFFNFIIMVIYRLLINTDPTIFLISLNMGSLSYLFFVIAYDLIIFIKNSKKMNS